MISTLRRTLFTSLRNSSLSSKYFLLVYNRSIYSNHHRPLMLMDLPRIAYPNLILIMKNFFSRILINGYFDSTFSMKPFCNGARQALTVVSHLIANGQFDDLPGFVTQEVINEVKQNYKYLSSEQKQKILVEDTEIVLSYPYSIAIIVNEQTNTRLIEITMIFHVLKDLESYQEMLQSTGSTTTNWISTIKKMRDNMIICNYKFLRNISKNTQDDSWIITGLNHWLPNEYLLEQ